MAIIFVLFCFSARFKRWWQSASEDGCKWQRQSTSEEGCASGGGNLQVKMGASGSANQPAKIGASGYCKEKGASTYENGKTGSECSACFPTSQTK